MPTSLSSSIPTNMFIDNSNPPPTLSEGSDSKEASRGAQGEGKAGMSGARRQESSLLPARLQPLGGLKQGGHSMAVPRIQGFNQVGSMVKSYSVPVDLSQIDLSPFSPEPVTTNTDLKRKGEPLEKYDLASEFKSPYAQRFVSVDSSDRQSLYWDMDNCVSYDSDSSDFSGLSDLEGSPAQYQPMMESAGVNQESVDPNNELLLQASTEVVEMILNTPFNRDAREQAIQKLSPALSENLAPPRQKAEFLVKVAKLMYDLKPNAPKVERLSNQQVFEVMLPGEEAPCRALDLLSEALNLDIYATDLQPMLELAFDAYDEIFLLHDGEEYEFDYNNRGDLYKMMGAS